MTQYVSKPHTALVSARAAVLARTAEQEHRAVEALNGEAAEKCSAALLRAIEAGKALTEAQALVKESFSRGARWQVRNPQTGELEGWLMENCPGWDVRAQLYMRLYKRQDEIEAEIEKSTTRSWIFGVKEAERYLSANKALKKLPPSEREEIEARAREKAAEKGEHIAKKHINEALREEREEGLEKTKRFLDEKKEREIEYERGYRPHLVKEYTDLLKQFSRDRAKLMKLMKPGDMAPEAVRFIENRYQTFIQEDRRLSHG